MNVNINLKFLISIIVVVAIAVGGYYKLLNDIKNAANLPAPVITRVEFDLKTKRYAELINQMEKDIIELKEDNEELEEDLEKLREKFYEGN